MFNLKLDKGMIALTVAYIGACEVESMIERRKKARIDAINAKYDAQEKELKHRLKLIKELQAEDDTSWML